MPFPPTFTNTWDITFPPDTQLANLLGQDLRNFRVDVMQRMSLLSGNFANRPTPETVNATWGGSGYGLLYFSIDTRQTFQWNGSAWVDVSGSLSSSRAIFKDTTAHTHTGDTTNDTIYTVPIPGGTLGTNGTLRFTLYMLPTVQTVSGNTVLTILYGGFLFATYVIVNPVSTTVTSVQGCLSNRGATNSQIMSALGFYTSGSPSVQATIVSGSIDSTVSQNLTIMAQNFANSDSQRYDQLIVELI